MSQRIINVLRAESVGDYRVRISFNDESEQEVNFQPFLANSRHPDIRRWLDHEKFVTFHIEHGELVWGDYELCFPVIDLYHNRIDHQTPLSEAA